MPPKSVAKVHPLVVRAQELLKTHGHAKKGSDRGITNLTALMLAVLPDKIAREAAAALAKSPQDFREVMNSVEVAFEEAEIQPDREEDWTRVIARFEEMMR
jgi:hypothetical protein